MEGSAAVDPEGFYLNRQSKAAVHLGTVDSKDPPADVDGLLEISYMSNTAVCRGMVETNAAAYECWAQSQDLHQQAKGLSRIGSRHESLQPAHRGRMGNRPAG